MVHGFGEILMRLTPNGFDRFAQAQQMQVNFGGTEFNVLATLANFGEAVNMITVLPNNDFGDLILAETHKQNINSQYIKRSEERLGLYFMETGAGNRGSRIIYDRANSAFAKSHFEYNFFNQIFEKNASQHLHITGITPAVSQNSADACLSAVKAAKANDYTVSCDLNLRKNLWKYGKKPNEIMPEIIKYVDILFADEEAADIMLNIKSDYGFVPNSERKDFCKKIIAHFPNIQKVILSWRKVISANENQISGLLYDGEIFAEAPIINVSGIIERIGTGDAFVGGALYGLKYFSDSIEKTIHFATASSVIKHTITGDYARFSLHEVEQIMQGATGKISR
jgi:2-dehydro-3-deoxygluconokinase